MENLKLMDFEYGEKRLPNGDVQKYYRNENFLTHSKGCRRDVGKIKPYLPCLNIVSDGSETCPFSTLEFYRSKISPTLLMDPETPYLLKHRKK